MESPEKLKAIVKQKYADIANRAQSSADSGCCGPCGCSSNGLSTFSDDYTSVQGYAPEADLGLGCGIPTSAAHIKPGDTVVDLGSGAGNDAFVARSIVGDTGKVIGVDMTEAMIERARQNNAKLGFGNVEFRLGDIEKLPLADSVADVVISNCVLNLVPDKSRAFAEIRRALKPGGHFSISDIVVTGDLPESIRSAAEMYAGCVSGALEKDEYLRIIRESGFTNITVTGEKTVALPDDILGGILDGDTLARFRRSGTAILSITVHGEKPNGGVGLS